MKPPRFDYARPARLDEAIALLSAHPGEAKVLASGQSLMPILAFRLASPRLLVDIARIEGPAWRAGRRWAFEEFARRRGRCRGRPGGAHRLCSKRGRVT